MSNFDKNINLLLKAMIMEQNDQDPNISDQEVEEASRIIDETRQELENLIKQNPEEFYKRANGNINSMNYAVNNMYSTISSIYESVKKSLETPIGEQTQANQVEDLGGGWKIEAANIIDDVKSYAHEKAKQAGGMIDGAFEESLDYLTDKLVDVVPFFVRQTIGESNYDFIRDDIKNMDDSWWYKILAVIDITGVLSWTYLDEAKKLYEENLGTENEDIYTLNLLAASIAVIPGISALKVFTLPFKILFSPLATLLRGGRISTFAKSVSNELKTTLNIGEKAGKGINIAARTGKISQVTTNFGSKLTKVVKPVAKYTAGVAKASTIVASGDIPGTLEKWRKEGEDVMKNIKPSQGTLGQFPKFNQITTQNTGGGNW
jgi:hypothetical protein